MTAAGSYAMNDAKDLYAAMYRAMIEKDSRTLTEILDDSFVLVHMTGMKQSKAEFIRAVSGGVLNYFSEHTESITAEVHDDTAQLTGKSRVDAAVFGGGQHTWPLRLDIALVRRNGEWKITRAEASTY